MAKPISLIYKDKARLALSVPLPATNILLCPVRSICHTRLKPINQGFTLRLRTLHLCRDEELSKHTHNMPSLTALEIELATLHFFYPTLSFIYVLSQFSFHTKQ